MANLTPSNVTNNDEYSAAATLIRFDHPLPLLRRPIPAGPTDDPELGPFVLAFPNQQSFFSSLKFCKSKLTEQCEAGLRIGCSLMASEKCRPPWWKTLTGKIDYKERSQCEEREMAACLQDSKEKCGKLAKEKTAGPFGWARVSGTNRKLGEKKVGRLISCVSGLGVLNGNARFEMLVGNELGLLTELNLSSEATYYRGSEIMGDGNYLN